jgi:predicted Rossmann fold flavoprotein
MNRLMESSADVAIVGGGAAGLAAAIFAAQAAPKGSRILILDAARTLGAKILVSGGGRCNVTHETVRPDDFNGSRNIVRNILAAFNAANTVRWFESLSVPLKREETGKLFPVANTAKAVLSALLRRCAELEIRIEPGCRVTRITPPAGDHAHFTIEHSRGGARSSRLILSTGGKSLPKTGSDGSGWEIVQALGHAVTPTYAALVPLVLEPQMFHADLGGISHEVALSIFASGKRIDHRTGSLLWTHFGVSGPVVMDASRHWVIAHETGQDPKMQCNLFPTETFATIEKWLMESCAGRPRAMLSTLLASRLPERLADTILHYISIEPTTLAGQVTREARRSLARALTALNLPVTGHRGWNYAEVTAGGVPLSEIDYRTMQSRKVPGLYLAGEILDCDGRIGGFNFQWAWSTGFLAGKAAVQSAFGF